ncbi:LysR family transcriptional regulator [Salinisphaera orenii MK-B5]|uniref:LysR family transcriptional regulator n=1 Tax=Salinisphaera orenii MK-B5 TaxID=856730 RepID=A0A423PFB5_9GAMM|nr:LysR family transcriptional regulator [Salinisphaera orenii]ROO24274.1 LysR family transcriptional regulator [Salinisphaera orenii MK-B5]
MRDLDPVSLRLFVAIADERSLTAAAAREHMALAAVSKRVRDLEARLDTALLYRRPRGVEPTPAGDALLHHARGLLDDMDRLAAELSEYSRGVRGHVRLDANTSAIIQFLPHDLSTFTRAHPAIKIDLQERVSSEAAQAVREGRTDIAVFADTPAAAELQRRVYRRDQLVLVTPHDHPLAGRATASLADALPYDIIGLQHNASLHGLLAEAARGLDTPLRLRIQVRSFEGICRMIAHGMGVGVLPAGAVTPTAARPLTVVPLADDWAERTLWLGMRDYATLPVIAREMVDHLTAADDHE